MKEGKRQGPAPGPFAQFGLFLSGLRVASILSNTLVHRVFVRLKVVKTGTLLPRTQEASRLVVPVRLKAEGPLPAHPWSPHPASLARPHCGRLSPATLALGAPQATTRAAVTWARAALSSAPAWRRW